MGTFEHIITLYSTSGELSERLEALVDTGAMFTTIPRPILERLGVEPFDTVPVRFANGTTERWQIGEVQAELDGKRRPIICFFGSADAPPLIGAHTLEAFLLTVDPVDKKLVPKEALLMYSTPQVSRRSAKTCRCGCGLSVKRRRVFVNKEHQLEWMIAGGAREMNALLSLEAKAKGGSISGKQAALSGRLHEAA